MSRKNLLITSPIRRSLLVSRGVPHYVLWGSYPRSLHGVIQRIEVQRDDGMKTIKPDIQEKMFYSSIEEPFDSNYVYALGADNNDMLASQLALHVFNSAMDKSITGTEGRPYWHTLDGSTKDRLRDDNDFSKIQIGQVNLLVVSNIASNSTNMKVEKLRDILVKYSHVPRIVIITGAEPFKYFQEVLYMRPTRVMYFGRKGAASD